ncbi:galactose mutarotase [Alteromonas aestuariivivens]|uniref:Aldose 1-epimerase n=1 Tax=Alteromonas aestuariivivens TaxID=1938339 RepID=A0A3D8MC54_9ALTE|nr:aldose epimerase family protein [Alteromonas aestuariivivens]RDV27981.1 galactose mutarotase [Alteromonas aestuariivivens]
MYNKTYLACGLAIVLAASSNHVLADNHALQVSSEPFGALSNGTPITLFTLENSNGLKANITNFGGILVNLFTPDKNGQMKDIVLGYDTLAGYEQDKSFQGALIGRFGNRIAKGQFTLDGKSYQLATNNKTNHLHGGVKGFGKQVWQASPFTTDSAVGVKLFRLSHDGEEGYPGNVAVTATYALHEDNRLTLTFEALTDQPTPINLTQHAYYNLAGSGSICDHVITFPASNYTPVDSTAIPLGENQPVSDTPFDFQNGKPVCTDINESNIQLEYGKGYDHNWVLDKAYGELALSARVVEPGSGRVMEIWSDQPGIQFYSGNFLNGTIQGKGGRSYDYRTALVLEPQHFPDSPNQTEFPSTILQPGQTYRNLIEYRFSVLE